MANPSYAIVTPSYHRDFARCRTLVGTVHRYVPENVHHYIVVARRDVQLFSELRSARTHLVIKEEVLPDWFHRLPFRSEWWFSTRTLPMRGWITQQIVKLSANRFTDADVWVFVDSDIFFIRRWDPARMLEEGRVPLFRETGPQFETGHFARWSRRTARLLGLPLQARYDASYVGPLIQWRRDRLEELQRHLERRTGRPWAEALARLPVFSEYSLYGMFAEHVAGGAGHWYDARIRTLNYWDTEPLDEAGLRAFRRGLAPVHEGVMVSSQSNTDPALVERVFGLEGPQPVERLHYSHA